MVSIWITPNTHVWRHWHYSNQVNLQCRIRLVDKWISSFCILIEYIFYDFNLEAASLRHTLQVEVLQDQTHLMLQEYCAHISSKDYEKEIPTTNSTLHSSSPTPPSASESITARDNPSPSSKARFGKLLLILPSLNSISPRAIETLFFRKTVGNVKVEKVIADLFQGI